MQLTSFLNMFEFFFIINEKERVRIISNLVNNLNLNFTEVFLLF